MMTLWHENAYYITGILQVESTSDVWIPQTKSWKCFTQYMPFVIPLTKGQ